MYWATCIDSVDSLAHGIGKDYLREWLCFCAAQPLQSPWFWRLRCHALTLSSSISAWMTPGSAHSGLGHKLRQYPCARPQTCAQCHDWCHSPGAWSCFSRTSLNGSVSSHISSTSFLKGKHDSLCCLRCGIHLQYPCLVSLSLCGARGPVCSLKIKSCSCMESPTLPFVKSC